MYRPSDSYKSWTSRSAAQSMPSYPSASPGPMPGTPHFHTVSLPHPNSAPRHASSSSGSQYHSTQYLGPSGILCLNPLLSVSASVPQLYYNVTRDVQCIQFQPGSQNYLDEPALHPPCQHLVLSIPSLPLWSPIEVQNPRGVTARDVLVRIHDVLSHGVSATEMSTMGMKRIDFLGPNVFFAGLFRSRDGRDRWEVHLVPAPRA